MFRARQQCINTEIEQALSCLLYSFPMKWVHLLNHHYHVSTWLLSDTNEQTNDSFNISACLKDPKSVSEFCVCCLTVRVCAHAILVTFSPYIAAFLRVIVCTAGSLCTYAHSHTHIRENKKTKPISLYHSNTSLKLPGLFGPIKDNDTQMQARHCGAL